MEDRVVLKAADGHELEAYVATPKGIPVGALVVVQEIFGVNGSIRGVADNYAEDGFLVIAPALFDRIERNVDLGYGEDDTKKAYNLHAKLDVNLALLDVAAAFHKAKESHKGVGVLGFCFGGLMSWLAATRGDTVEMRPDCAVGYYAGGVGKVAAEEPSCPVLLHFGAADSHIGPEQQEAVQAAHPEVQIFVYEGAEHAFANSARPSYKEDAAKLARQRSLEFLKTHIA